MLIDHYIWNKNCVKLLDLFSHLFFCGWIFKARTGKFCAPIRPFHCPFLRLDYQRKRTRRDACGVYAAGDSRRTVFVGNRLRVCLVTLVASKRSANALETTNPLPFMAKLARLISVTVKASGRGDRRVWCHSCVTTGPPGSALSTGSTGWCTQTVGVGFTGKRDALKWIVTVVYWVTSLRRYESAWELRLYKQDFFGANVLK